jgi:hypothetical protein
VANKPVPKKKSPTGCDPNANSVASTGSGSNAGSAPGGTASQTSGTSSPSGNCPPPKVVVRQGGTSDPSIQLAGGSGGAQPPKADATTNQMVGSTEENLKKLAGRRLSATEQDMVSQIHQYIEQSKAAATDGDPERARTLAWKAETLSEDLIKPVQ